MVELYRSDIVNVDINKSLNRMYVGGVLATGDNKANRFGANVYRGGDPVSLDACGVTGYFIRPNMETVVVRGVAEGHTAYVDLEQACYACEGQFSLAIKVSSDGVVHTVRIVDGYIRQTQTDVMIDPGTAVPSLDDLFAQIAAMEAVTAEANETIATIKTDTAAAIADANAAAADTREATAELSETTATPIIESTTGSMVSITDGADRPAVQLVSHIEPVQEGEGDPSPDNVRPISGWDSVTAQRTGKNLANIHGQWDASTVDLNIDGESVIVTALKTGATAAAKLKIEYPLNEPLTLSFDAVVLSGNTSASKPFVYFRRNSNIVGQQPISADKTHYTAVFNNGIPEANMEMWLYVNSTFSNSEIISIKFDNIQVETGSTATAYEPYQGQTLTADLPETVYGGTLDWGAGVVTVTHKKILVDGSTLDVRSVSSISDDAIYATFDLKTAGRMEQSTNETLLADKFRTGAAVSRGNCYITAGGSVLVLCPHDVTLNTKALYDAWLQSNPVTVVYALANPYTIQLTPQQLDTLKGTNNVWSDTGDTTLSYIADTKLYIDKKIAAIAAATV